ncbi:MAG: gamma-glutamyl-gamma-aminobutyrate hydrolase family protein [Limisphaerales bacterium]
MNTKVALCLALLLGVSHCGGQPDLSSGKSAPLAKRVDVGLLCKSNDLPLLTNYFKAINENGARIVPLPYKGSTNPSLQLLTVSALLIPGGDDIDPDLYHEKQVVTNLDNPDRHFDDYECASVRQAEARNMTILGICRGLQILNVSFNGTLFQDLPSQLGTKVQHRLCPNGKSFPQPCFHEITIQKGSLLFRSVKTERLEVNSYHHQGVKVLGEGLVPTAWSDDRLVEAFENKKGNILAVQFHPEKMRATNFLFNAIFRDFINRAAASQP